MDSPPSRAVGRDESREGEGWRYTNTSALHAGGEHKTQSMAGAARRREAHVTEVVVHRYKYKLYKYKLYKYKLT